MRVLLGVTGSVAARLTPTLVHLLQEAGHEVQVVATSASMHFFNTKEVNAPVNTDEEEWTTYAVNGRVLHIDLRNWADVLLIAPLCANTLSKLAHGASDNLLTCIARAWEIGKPLVVAPAMNTLMWNHPATAEHLVALRRWHGVHLTVIDPVTKTLFCGETGVGALAPLPHIIGSLEAAFKERYTV